MENNKMLGPDGLGYTDLLDDAIMEKLKAEAEAPPKFFPLRPSSSGACGRKLAYELMNYLGYAKFPGELRTPEVYRLLELGSSVEFSALKNFKLLTMFRQAYKQQVVTLFRLDPLPGEAEGKLIEGSVDVVLVSDHYKCVMDIKSYKEAFSSYFRSRTDETLAKYRNMKSVTPISETAYYIDDLTAFVEEIGRDDFVVDNLLQVNSYACSDFLRERGIDHGVILKYNKNDSRHYELRFRPSQEEFERLRDRFNRVNKAVAEKQPEAVSRDFMLGSMRCAFCPFASTCWDEDAKKAWLKQLPPKAWPKDLAKLKADDATKNSLAVLFDQYEEAKAQESEAKDAEAAIIELLHKLQVSKIRLDDGTVYEVKFLKTPREHYELRRSKA